MVKPLISFGFVLIGIVSCCFLNYFLLENLIIPDPCYYHTGEDEVTWLFDLFYHFPSSEGYHPSPTTFNFVVTILAGAFLGWWAGTFFSRRGAEQEK